MRPDLGGLRAGYRAGRAWFAILATLGRLRARPPIAAADGARALSQVFRELCELHRIEIAIAGEIPTRPSVIVANHLSYLDPVVALVAAPAIPIAKLEVGSWPGIGTAARALGVLLVDRSDPMHRARVLRQAVSALRAGACVLNFPEGTTTDGRRLLPFARGIFGAARIARAPIVPLGIEYESPRLAWTGDELFLPHYWQTAARAATRVQLRFGPAIAAPPYALPEEIADHAHARVRALMREDCHDAAERIRLSQARPDPVLSAAGR